MTYVTNFAHDIFVSYSTIDNETLVGEGEHQRGWVDVLLDKVRRELKPRLGGRDCDILIDHEFMRNNLPITSQILDAVRGSATLLVVMSPAYLNSVWCDRERSAFLDVVKDRVATGAILLVRARPVAREKQPEELRDLRGIEFFTSVEGAGSHRVLGYPDPNERLFIDRIITLSGELAEQLTRLRGEASRAAVAPPSGKRVFVAEATDDLEEREAELRAYLKQAGLDVLPSPQSRYPTTDLAAYEAAVLRELESCCLFTQVLSAARGKELPFAPGKRLPALQHELALRAHKPVLTWRERNEPLDAVKDPEHRALLEGAQASGIDEFKRTAAERALRPPPPAQPPPRAAAIFVNADAPDRALAADISNALAELGVDCYWTPERGSPADIRLALEDNLRNCDGLVLVYGKTRLDWVQQQLRQARKMNGARDRPLATMAIFECPPPDKSEVPVTIKNLILLDCRQGLDPQKIRQFVDHLRG
jgi:TIR domain-containing protein